MNALLFYDNPDLEIDAQALATRFNFVLHGRFNHSATKNSSINSPILYLTNDGLELHPQDMKPWRIDFLSQARNHRRAHGGREVIIKACGIKKVPTNKQDISSVNSPITIVDLTAGLAKDAFVLACSGAKMILVERHPVIAALLEDALKRFYADPVLSKNIFISIYFDDAEHFLTHTLSKKTENNCNMSDLPDVIYIDPMHPERQKSAQVKKDMQILQQWIPPEDHPEYLLNLSLQYAKKRVVLKWPKNAPSIQGHKPAFVYEENTVRFEVYKPNNPS